MKPTTEKLLDQMDGHLGQFDVHAHYRPCAKAFVCVFGAFVVELSRVIDLAEDVVSVQYGIKKKTKGE